METKQKAVVTGGAGFIGSHIADALVAEGYEVHVVDTLVAGRREHVPEGATLHEVDIVDTPALVSIFKDAAAVLHEAALPRVQFSIDEPIEAHRTNVDGTLSVLVAAHAARAGRVIFASSSAVYGNQETLPLREDMPTELVHPYGLHKYMGERYLQLFSELYGLPTVSLRYFNAYGPRLDPEGPYALVIGRFLKQRLNGEPLTITGDGTQTRDFTHVRDIARANLAAMTSERVGKGEVVNIGSGKSVSVNELADQFGGERIYVPARIEVKHSLADTARARELLGWQAEMALEDGIAELKQLFGV
jgi:UDP-glucose 4-epimerase